MNGSFRAEMEKGKQFGQWNGVLSNGKLRDTVGASDMGTTNRDKLVDAGGWHEQIRMRDDCRCLRLTMALCCWTHELVLVRFIV